MKLLFFLYLFESPTRHAFSLRMAVCPPDGGFLLLFFPLDVMPTLHPPLITKLINLSPLLAADPVLSFFFLRHPFPKGFHGLFFFRRIFFSWPSALLLLPLRCHFPQRDASLPDWRPPGVPRDPPFHCETGLFSQTVFVPGLWSYPVVFFSLSLRFVSIPSFCLRIVLLYWLHSILLFVLLLCFQNVSCIGVLSYSSSSRADLSLLAQPEEMIILQT